jgi:glycosyltransferase involved in cell wall biosynthesis
MKQNKLLSVIVPVYNVEKILSRCIESITNQTYLNLEIILVDDGSSDKSGKICDDYAMLDNRIHVIHQNNQGLSGARNSGVSLARGNFVAFVDSDDWLNLHMYEKLIDLIDTYDLDIARGSISRTDGIHYTDIIPPSNIANRVLSGDEVFNCYFSEFLCKVVWNAVYKREIVEGIISPDRCHFEDNYVSGRYLYRSRKIMISDDVLYYYWINPNGITNSSSKRLFDICICTNKLKHDLLAEGLKNSEFIKKLDTKLARELYHFIRAKDSRYKVIALNINIKKFIDANLNFFRRFKFNFLIKRCHIAILKDGDDFYGK